MHAIGTITQLQIQRSRLKAGEKPNRVYDPAPILPVERLAVGSGGAFGLAPGQGWIVDIHHRAHPDSRNPDGQNGLSIGFTSHYAAMRDRFGSRIQLGCAGENIIVETARPFSMADIEMGIAILAPDGAERLRLTVLDVAHPCKPFTGWALGREVDTDAFKTHLQFLDGGMRGFLLGGDVTGVVSLGDRVAVL
jgi:MOSC domain